MPSYSRHDLADLSAFAAICRRGSFRLAATELGVSTSALSHALRNLEARLGVKLLNRTTRSVAPTEAGSRLAAQLDQSFGEIGEALSELGRYRSGPLGGLRINVPRDASRLLLSPVLARYLEDYPGVKIEVVVDNNMVDIVKAGFDAGMRFGDTVPQDMVCTPLTPPLRWVVVGAPAYLGRHGTPRKPEDLLRHACIRLRLGDQTMYRWELGPRAAGARHRRARRVDRERNRHGAGSRAGWHRPGLLPGALRRAAPARRTPAARAGRVVAGGRATGHVLPQPAATGARAQPPDRGDPRRQRTARRHRRLGPARLRARVAPAGKRAPACYREGLPRLPETPCPPTP